jgi:hypothetical protein
MLQTTGMQKWIPSVAGAFGHAGKLGTPPLPAQLLRVPREVLLIELAVLMSMPDDTIALYQNHEGTSCKISAKPAIIIVQ